MKRFTLPAAILLAASALLWLGILRSFGRARQAETMLLAEQRKVDLTRQQLAGIQRAVAAAKDKSIPADRFLATWNTELDAEANVEHVFGRLDTLAVNNLLSPSGKNFTLNTSYFFNGRHLPVQNVNITVAGDYARTLNWLGAVEYAFPLARVEQISYTTNGTSLSLAVQFVFPRKFDAE